MADEAMTTAGKLLRERRDTFLSDWKYYDDLHLMPDEIDALVATAKLVALEGAHTAQCHCCDRFIPVQGRDWCAVCGNDEADHPHTDKLCQAKRDEARRVAGGGEE